MNENLVDEILSRVLEAMKSSQDIQETKQKNDKTKVLILTQEHGTYCHELLEDPQILEQYHIDCAYTKNYNLNLAEYEVVVLCNLTNMVLEKLYSGICDVPFLNLATQAILLGKKIYVPAEEVEIFRYQDKAPKAYYSMMINKVKFLQDCGINILETKQLKHILSKQTEVGDKAKEQTHKVKTDSTCDKSIQLNKKVITEKDIERAHSEGAAVICISAKSIVSDLAKEFAKNRNIQFKRNEPLSEKVGKDI